MPRIKQLLNGIVVELTGLSVAVEQTTNQQPTTVAISSLYRDCMNLISTCQRQLNDTQGIINVKQLVEQLNYTKVKYSDKTSTAYSSLSALHKQLCAQFLEMINHLLSHEELQSKGIVIHHNKGQLMQYTHDIALGGEMHSGVVPAEQKEQVKQQYNTGNGGIDGLHFAPQFGEESDRGLKDMSRGHFFPGLFNTFGKSDEELKTLLACYVPDETLRSACSSLLGQALVSSVSPLGLLRAQWPGTNTRVPLFQKGPTVWNLEVKVSADDELSLTITENHLVISPLNDPTSGYILSNKTNALEKIDFNQARELEELVSNNNIDMVDETAILSNLHVAMQMNDQAQIDTIKQQLANNAEATSKQKQQNNAIDMAKVEKRFNCRPIIQSELKLKITKHKDNALDGHITITAEEYYCRVHAAAVQSLHCDMAPSYRQPEEIQTETNPFSLAVKLLTGVTNYSFGVFTSNSTCKPNATTQNEKHHTLLTSHSYLR